MSLYPVLLGVSLYRRRTLRLRITVFKLSVGRVKEGARNEWNEQTHFVLLLFDFFNNGARVALDYFGGSGNVCCVDVLAFLIIVVRWSV